MKITSVELLTDNIAATKVFYEKTIGFPVIHHSEETVSFTAGSSVLCFRTSVQRHPVYHFAFNIPPNQFEEAFEWAASKFTLFNISSETTIADFVNWNAKAFYFLDNNKNIVEFIARYDLHADSLKPFCGAGILSISEIGLVVDDVKTFCEGMIENHGLQYYEKQAPQHDFAPMGDAEGLFIVVSDNRKWYPTEIRSKKLMTKIIVEKDGRTIEIDMAGND